MRSSPGRDVARGGRGKRKSRSLSSVQTAAGFGMTISRCASGMERGFGGEAGGAGFAVEGVADAAEADGSAEASVLTMPASFLAGALELRESGGREGSVAAAETVGIGAETFGEFRDPGVADAEKAGDAKCGPARFGRAPPLPDELFDDLGFEAAAPGKRGAAPGGAGFADVDEARLTSARRFVAGSFAAHEEFSAGEDT